MTNHTPTPPAEWTRDHKARLSQALHLLSRTLPQFGGTTFEAEDAKLYFKALADLPPNECLDACGWFLAHSKWFPRPADFRERIEGMASTYRCSHRENRHRAPDGSLICLDCKAILEPPDTTKRPTLAPMVRPKLPGPKRVLAQEPKPPKEQPKPLPPPRPTRSTDEMQGIAADFRAKHRRAAE